jgi:hypothetical protein
LVLISIDLVDYSEQMHGNQDYINDKTIANHIEADCVTMLLSARDLQSRNESLVSEITNILIDNDNNKKKKKN